MERKINLGIFVLIASFIIGILLGIPFYEVLRIFAMGAVDHTTLKIVAIVILIELMGNALAKSGSLGKINSSIEMFVKNRHISLIFPSLLMGLLPVPAGAMLSAPLVEESGSKMNLSPEIKTFLNYWFRHIFEFVWPIYPGIILAAAILNVSIYRVIIAQFPLALTSVATGILFGLTRVSYKGKVTKIEKNPGAVRGFFVFLTYAWPVLAIVILVLVVRIDIVLSLLIIVVCVIFATKIVRKLPFLMKESLSWRTILLVVSVLIFKKILESSGALPLIPQLFSHFRIPPTITLFTIPFFVGIISGLSMGVVGIAFPILLPIIGVKNPDLTYAMLAYAGGVSGYLLSPLHLCLVVSCSYFKADFIKVWRMLILPVMCIGLAAFVIVLFKKGGII